MKPQRRRAPHTDDGKGAEEALSGDQSELDLSQCQLETLHEDGEFVLYRGLRPTKSATSPPSILALLPAIERPAPGTIKKMEHEFSLKDELDPAWAIRPIALTQYKGRTALLFDDPHGEPLDRLVGRPMEFRQFLRCGICLAVALGQVHRRGLVHKNIKPSNVLTNAAMDQAWLRGFGIASRLRRERHGAEPPEFILGTLAYMAPEQTGRMNRSIDSRSDLYALGITLYELLTGTLPFAASDPMEWVHCHIARQPLPPAERLRDIPGCVSAIIIKLLAKTPEERYQTAAGAETDLRRCLEDWDRERSIHDFPIGEHDRPDRLLIPEKLYGREREIETLLASFDRVVKSGTPELVLVSGYSGIGKSSVVNELHKVLVPPRGLFAAGKFDQHKRDIPYSTLAQALESLTRPLLARSETELATWRDLMRKALDPNGRLMIELVPELKLILGEQPPVPQLPPQDAQRRFRLLLRRFVGVFARAEHPLVLFLDDLQWVDSATLEVLEDLLTQADVKHLLMVGAYRDNEVDAAHPMTRKLEGVRKTGAIINEIKLAPLTQEDMAELITDALQCEPKGALLLAQSVYDRTAGNPFFAIQFLSALEHERLLAFDYVNRRWSWDIDRINAKGYTENVVDLLVANLSRLPAETQKALQELACLGSAARVTTLSLVYGREEPQVHSDLFEAVRAEMVERQEGSYKFIHDRVQEAAYSLIPEAQRAEVHLRIGRLLVAHSAPEKREETIFEIVNQLNRGAGLITLRSEREQLAELNLVAGERAKNATAYAAALKYLMTGRDLLAGDCWEHHRDLVFRLEFHRAECELLAGQWEAAEDHLNMLVGRAANTAELAVVTCSRMDLYTTLAQSPHAVAVGLSYLGQVGIACSPHPTDEEVRREYDRIFSQIGGRTIEELIELPLMSDRESVATLDVLTKAIVPAWFTDPNLSYMLTCRAVNLTLERGNGDASCTAYIHLGISAGPHFGNYKAGAQFGHLGFELVEKRGLKRYQARTYMLFGNVVLPWTRHIRDGRDLVQRAFDAAHRIGDLTFAAYSRDHLITNLLAAGDPLAEVQREAEEGLRFAEKLRFGRVIDEINTQLGLIRTLRGITPRFGCFNDDEFDETRFEHHLVSNPIFAMTEFWYWTRKAQARFLAGDYASTVEAILRAERLVWTSPSFFETAEYHFYGALSHAASWDSASPSQKEQHFDALSTHQRQLQIWAENCPQNFQNRAALVSAEIARIEGRELEAEHLYEEAIRSSRENDFVHNEALAYERASAFYRARGFEEFADTYLRNARSCYLSWGADGKVRQLDDLYPQLAKKHPPTASSTIDTQVEHLDLTAIINASEAVSGGMVFQKLIDVLMRAVIEHAGAERGLLILPTGAELQLKAEGSTAGDAIVVRLRDVPINSDLLPESIAHHVVRTKEAVILDDASVQRTSFSEDPYFLPRKTRSILCLPLINQRKLIGVLYLENNLASRVFTPSRVGVVKILASQAAISLETARLYRDLRDSQSYLAEAQRLTATGSFGWKAASGEIVWSEETYRIFELERKTKPTVEFVLSRVHSDDRQSVQQYIERILHERTELDIEHRLQMPDGSIKYVHVVGRPSEDEDGCLEFVGAVTDVSEHKRAGAEVKESYLRLAEAQQLSKTGSFITDLVADDHNWSEETFRIFDFDPSTKVTVQMIRNMIHPEDLPSFDSMIARAMTGADVDFVFRILTSRGAVKHIRGMARVIEQIAGRPLFVGALQDVTESKLAEEALNKARSELAYVARVTTLNALTASIAHEVNQPLSGIITNASTCLRMLNSDPPNVDGARETARRAIRDGNRASDVITRLRALFSKKELTLEPLDLSEATREVIALSLSDLQRNRVTLRSELPDDLPRVTGDRVQLQQVILNLVRNASDAMVGVDDRPRELLIKTERDEVDRVRLSVIDAGVGFRPEARDKLFEAFYTTKNDGMGIGLSVSRSIIEAHHGRLWARPNDGPGATFSFAIPCGTDTKVQ